MSVPMLRCYHFTLGASYAPVTMTAEVKAYSREEAVDRLCGYLPEMEHVLGAERDDLVEGVEIHFNLAVITADQIDEEYLLPEETLTAFLNERLAERESDFEVEWVELPTNALNDTMDQLIDGRYPVVVFGHRTAASGQRDEEEGIEIEVTVAEGALVLNAGDLLRQIEGQR